MPTVLITGANRGIGLEFARAYAGDGWRVHACCRQPEKANELRSISGDVQIHRLDVTDGLQVASLARLLADEPVDVLINNAGVFGPRAGFGETDYDEWIEVLRCNTLAPMRMAEQFVEHVAKSGRKVIVNMSTGMASLEQTTSGWAMIYRSSKTAVNMVGKGLAADLRERGIIVAMLNPGWVLTDMGGPDAKTSPEESVAGMRKEIDALTLEDSGRFIRFDGTSVPW